VVPESGLGAVAGKFFVELEETHFGAFLAGSVGVTQVTFQVAVHALAVLEEMGLGLADTGSSDNHKVVLVAVNTLAVLVASGLAFARAGSALSVVGLILEEEGEFALTGLSDGLPEDWAAVVAYSGGEVAAQISAVFVANGTILDDGWRVSGDLVVGCLGAVTPVGSVRHVEVGDTGLADSGGVYAVGVGALGAAIEAT